MATAGGFAPSQGAIFGLLIPKLWLRRFSSCDNGWKPPGRATPVRTDGGYWPPPRNSAISGGARLLSFFSQSRLAFLKVKDTLYESWKRSRFEILKIDF